MLNIYPEKRNIPVATNAISSLALKITTVVENLRDSSGNEQGFKNKAAVQEPYWDCALELVCVTPKS